MVDLTLANWLSNRQLHIERFQLAQENQLKRE